MDRGREWFAHKPGGVLVSSKAKACLATIQAEEKTCPVDVTLAHTQAGFLKSMVPWVAQYLIVLLVRLLVPFLQ